MTYEISNHIIEIGKNANDNWELLESSQPNDILFHLDDKPSPYVIVTKCKKKNLSDLLISSAAKLCKLYSKYKDCDETMKVSYIKIKHTQKGNKLGQVTYLKKPEYINI